VRPADFLAGLPNSLGGGDAGRGFQLSHRPGIVPRKGRDRVPGLLRGVGQAAAGFPRRIRAVAEASLQQAEALSRASLIPGFRWTPVSDPHPVIRSHELRPGGNRPGPPHKWQSYDMAVERLSIAAQGNVISLVADEFREIGWVLKEIADDLEPSAPKRQEPSDFSAAPDAHGRRQ
jgi:hypothetical protein